MEGSVGTGGHLKGAGSAFLGPRGRGWSGWWDAVYTATGSPALKAVGSYSVKDVELL